MIVHEALYSYLRDQKQDKNSVRARKLVGYVFSDLKEDALKVKIQEILNETFKPTPAPIAGMQFAKIKAGTFMMGSPSSESDRYNNETWHRVTLTQDFEIMTTEVTQKQWVEVMGGNPSYFKERKYCPDTHTTIKGVEICPNHPVEQVSWDDVKDFIRTLNHLKKDGYYYRLPTEAEWEYAARAGTTTPYSYQNGRLDDNAWYDSNSGRQTQEVTSCPNKKVDCRNKWGLYHVAGNVWEWVEDAYRSDYEKLSCTDPLNESGSPRVIRGGSWGSYAQHLRSATRVSCGPGYRYDYVGFRLVRQ